MNVFNAVHPVSSISKVSQPKFTRKGDVLLQPAFVLKFLFSFLLSLLVLLTDFLKERCDRLGFYGSVSADISSSGFDVNFYVCNSCSILAAIMLFLHQDIHLIYGVHWAILFDVIRERFSKSDHRDPALVKNLVSHYSIRYPFSSDPNISFRYPSIL